MELSHGGDVSGYRLAYGREPLDFSSNLNPLGMPESVKAAARQAVEESAAYPDPLCRRLREGLARREGVRDRQILCGNGAADLIYRIVLAVKPKRALLPVPSFSEYEEALALAESSIAYHSLAGSGLALTEAILSAITGGVDILFLCNPNNPTGLIANRELLFPILRRCRESGAMVVMDECFLDLTVRQDASLVPLVGEFPNLVVLKAFTKTYAMAGLRLGYALSGDEALLGRIRRAGQYWPVSTVAQAAGLAALDCDHYLEQARKLIAREAIFLSEGLAGLGYSPVPSEANYILFHGADGALAERLRERGILIRCCGNYRGLEPGWFRIAVRTRTENITLLEALKEVARG